MNPVLRESTRRFHTIMYLHALARLLTAYIIEFLEENATAVPPVTAECLYSYGLLCYNHILPHVCCRMGTHSYSNLSINLYSRFSNCAP